jgi:excisionase family DNA binding protein
MTKGVRNRMLTTSGVATMLNLHINTVRRWSNQGILKPYRIGPRGDRRFMRDDVLHLLNMQTFDNSKLSGKNR